MPVSLVRAIAFEETVSLTDAVQANHFRFVVNPNAIRLDSQFECQVREQRMLFAATGKSDLATIDRSMLSAGPGVDGATA